MLTALVAMLKISIHAPAKGATLARQLDHAARLYFNPRSREGSDLVGGAVVNAVLPFQSTLPRRERQQKSPRLFPMIFAK